MTRTRKVFTFSNVVACVALFIALGGTVYAAGKISGKQIQASSLPGNRIKPKTVTAKQIKPNTLTGNQIKAGSLTGAKIKQSTLTGVSAASLATVYYAVATVTVPSGNPPNGTAGAASCPPGTFVIGGGANLSNEEKSFVNDNGPSPLHTAWTATLYGSEGTSMTVTAICTAVKAIR